MRGAHSAAGEIAYNLRHPHDEVGVRHDRAPLAEYAGGKAIGERASLVFGAPHTAEEIFRKAASDTEARAFVQATLEKVAFHLSNLAIALDPERIVVGGGSHVRKTRCCRTWPRISSGLSRSRPH